MKKVCLIIVTYNRFEVLLETLRSIKSQIYGPSRIVIVDNCSTDGTLNKLKDIDQNFEIVQLSSNLGYAAGLSEGIIYSMKKFTDIDFFWLMDDDSHPQANALELLLNTYHKSEYQGLLSVTGFIDTIWSGPIRISKYKHKKKHLLNEALALYEVDHALVDGALVSREVVDKVGTPNSLFFMMCEDVEYSKRIKKAGYKIMLLENEDLMQRLHYGGGKQFSKSTLWRGYYHARNHLLIVKKYFSWSGLLSYIVRQVKYLVASLAAKDRYKRIRYRLLGVFHGIIGRDGKTVDPQKI